MELRDRLKPYYDALVKGIEAENWYLSLMAALTLPDICTSLEGKRKPDDYVEWFDNYVKQYKITIYRSENDQVTTLPNGGTMTKRKKPFTPIEVETPHVFLTGVIAYALRCAFLHNGDGEVANQRITKHPNNQNFLLGIKKVKFLAKPTNLAIEQTDSTVLLNPKIYCQAILEGIDKWIIDNEYNQKVLDNTEELIIFE
ncbi:hypothetical protein R4Z10_21565 (plasmid) [Niallia sp. XMNu-256]|uniref:hypothetical protein n=1 Tax=Niallia sp. XMNu-256 TaxID=3082444 RepID=UPI0030CC6C0E